MSKKMDDILDEVFDFFLNEDIDIVIDEIDKCEPTGFGLAIAEAGITECFCDHFFIESNSTFYSSNSTSFEAVCTDGANSGVSFKDAQWAQAA